MNKKIVRLVLLVFLLTGTLMYAEKAPPTPEVNNAPVPPGLPIDGGLSLLFVSGVAYGIYTLKIKK